MPKHPNRLYDLPTFIQKITSSRSINGGKSSVNVSHTICALTSKQAWIYRFRIVRIWTQGT